MSCLPPGFSNLCPPSTDPASMDARTAAAAILKKAELQQSTRPIWPGNRPRLSLQHAHKKAAKTKTAAIVRGRFQLWLSFRTLEVDFHPKLQDSRIARRCFEAQQMGLVWLNVLKVSKRNWPVKRSVNLMFLKRESSVRQNPGPRMAPGRSLVSTVCEAGGAANASGTLRVHLDGATFHSDAFIDRAHFECEMARTIPVCMAFLKPVASAVTLYRPTGRSGTTYWPCCRLQLGGPQYFDPCSLRSRLHWQRRRLSGP